MSKIGLMIVLEMDRLKLNRYLLVVAVLLLLSELLIGQRPNQKEMVKNPEFGKTIDSYLKFTVPVITCEKLFENLDSFTILDAREKNEYMVSHLRNAVPVGYDDFQLNLLDSLEREKPIVVYCSIGYRSEKIGERLKKSGFTRVYNLYGSIFEWVNQGYPVYDERAIPVLKVHTYSRKWSKWVERPQIEKIW